MKVSCKTIVNHLFMMICIIIMAEVSGYFWHKYVAHLGYLGDTIRITHYCHHEEIYPYNNIESVKYHTSHDSWPWLILYFLIMGIVYIVYKMKKINKSNFRFILIFGTLYAYMIDSTHASFHIKGHWLNNFAYYRKQKKVHYIHHFDNVNYGIIFPWFDMLFGTYKDKHKNIKFDVFDGFESECKDRIKFFDFL